MLIKQKFYCLHLTTLKRFEMVITTLDKIRFRGYYIYSTMDMKRRVKNNESVGGFSWHQHSIVLVEWDWFHLCVYLGWKLCGGRYMNTNRYVCCNNRMKFIGRPGGACCGIRGYNPSSQICCGGRVFRKKNVNTGCCYGKVCIQPTFINHLFSSFSQNYLC